MAGAALKDVSRLLSGNLLAKLFGVAALMLFTRLLSKTQLAVFPAYVMLLGISNLFFSFGIFATFVRKLPSFIREDAVMARSLVVTGTFVIVGGMAVVALAGFMTSPSIAEFVFKDAGQSGIIRVMLVGFVAASFAKVAENIMWGRGQFAATSVVQIIDSVFRPIITIGLYFWLGYPGIVYGLVAAQLANAACSLYCVRDMFAGRFPKVYPIRQLMSESLPFYIDGYLWYLKGDGDTLLVSALMGPVALAEYYIAKTLYSNIILVLTALDKVALERLARYANEPQQFREKSREMQVRISRTMIPLTLLVIAVTPYAMTILAGARYESARWPAIGLLVAALVQFVVIAADRAVFVSLSGVWRLAKTAMEASAALTIASLLVAPLGLMGIVAARIVAPAIAGIFGLILLHRKLDLSLPIGSAVPTLLAGAPVTALILLGQPPLQGAAHALFGLMGGVAVWVIAFAALSYCVDRATFNYATHALALLLRPIVPHAHSCRPASPEWRLREPNSASK